MNEDATPPFTTAPAAVEPEPAIARWRWAMHLLVLTALPITAAVLGIFLRHRTTAMLPESVSGLLRMIGEQMVFFAGFFLLAWIASRVNRQQLLMSWHGGLMPVVWGVAYSIALRLLIVVGATTLVVFWLLVKWLMGEAPSHDIDHTALRPQIEHLVNLNALVDNPVYLALMLTVVSFVMAGFREELWRSAMFAGIFGLFPGLRNKPWGPAVAVLVVAVLFGLAHTPQGWAGVAVTACLGAGLGAIMLWHGSIWEAVLAHGFFDATTFLFLYAAGKYFPHQLPGF